MDERGKTTIRQEYSQSHIPVLEQDEAVGHAVRAGYMYAGMADVAALSGDPAYIGAIDRIWENIVSRKLYITGGVGATNNGEAFGDNYELPNMSAYCETCAAIANVYVNYRMFLLHGEAKYFDVLERSLYNGLISGVSLDGGGFFYPNPLESIGQHQRQAWFGCACCPSNICRFIPSVPGYVYAVKDNALYVNLYMSNTLNQKVLGKDVTLRQETRYPWDGDVEITVEKTALRKEMALRLRIPGWVRGQVVPSDLYTYDDGKQLGYSVLVNGEKVESALDDGYFTVTRRWKKGDKVTVRFDMAPRIVKAHPEVKADDGRIAVEKGPVVYCAEWPDNDFSVRSVLMGQEPVFTVIPSDELCGIDKISTAAQSLSYDKGGRLQVKDVKLTLIPYYAWAHRGRGEMAVWLPQDLRATRPAMPATLSSESRVTASMRMAALSAVNDRMVPRRGGDAAPYCHTWPKEGGTEWIAYEFPAPSTVNRTGVFWFDDQPWGGCAVPASWRLLYKDTHGAWTEVSAENAYGTQKGQMNEVRFTPVTTTAVRLEFTQQEGLSAGLYEWEVK